jgi:hypothetical protein
MRASAEVVQQNVEAAAELARSAARPMTPAQRMKGWQAVTFRLDGRKRPAGRIALASILALGATAAAAVMVVRTSRHNPTPGGQILAFAVEGGEIGDGGYVRSSSPTGAVLRFSEGTQMRLMPGARGRLGKVDGHGARFAIEQGEAEVKVTPRPGARWLVDAGPFLITVRGTVFTASWDGATERLDVDMTKGLVSVTGPVAEDAVAVRAGQHLTVNVQRKEVLLRQNDLVRAQLGAHATALPPAPSEAPTATPPARARDSRSTTSEQGPRGSRTSGGRPARGTTSHGRLLPGPRSWATALGAGDFEGILQDAERRGIEESLAEAPAADLAALGDAARYRRRDALARQVLTTERTRFPKSARARDAAFLLGRLEDSAPDGGSRAIEWYDRYLKEAPLGAYASEALGRKMTTTATVRGPDAAREIASEYLRRFPSGTYTATAHAFLDGR